MWKLVYREKTLAFPKISKERLAIQMGLKSGVGQKRDDKETPAKKQGQRKENVQKRLVVHNIPLI